MRAPLSALSIAALAVSLAWTPVVAQEGKEPAPSEPKKEQPAKEEPKGEAKGEPKKEGEAAEPEKKAKELPKNDPKVQETLKKAYDKVYSARAKGLSKVAATTKIKTENSGGGGGGGRGPGGMGMPEVEVNYKLAWVRDSALNMKAIEEEKKEGEEGGGNPMLEGIKWGIRSSMGRFEKLFEFVIGWEKFEDRFPKDKRAFVSEKTAEKGQTAVRVWRIEKDELKSDMFYINDKDGVVVRTIVDGADTTYEVEKKGRDVFVVAVKSTVTETQQGRETTTTLEGKLTERKKIGDYELAQKLTTEVTMRGFKVKLVQTFSDLKFNKDVTDQMIEDATDNSEPSAPPGFPGGQGRGGRGGEGGEGEKKEGEKKEGDKKEGDNADGGKKNAGSEKKEDGKDDSREDDERRGGGGRRGGR